jgi:hypothetical protein|eukprot:Tamp_20960.p2 GENE.Tamp_20960~~Tamp_20960.p2  ORF type:complete len:246 (+),score=32.61 Tamp_20960:304-1041(+)
MAWSGVRRRISCLVVVLVLFALLIALEDSFHLSTRRVWLAHVLPQSSDVWDNIHEQGQKLGEGGVFGYGNWLKNQPSIRYLLRQPKYARLADMSSSVGIILATLQESNPGAEHFGSDISRVMVNATQQRCRQCHVAQFDVGRFQAPEGEAVPYAFPGTFDYVLVEDVLYYIAWGGWPPFVLRICEPCRRMALTHQKRWLDRVKALTRRKVVISAHQENPIVVDMLRALGATQHYGVYLVDGTAPA